MNVLFVSSEVAPFSKTGGLGDVSGALPKALGALGHDVVVVTPLYATTRLSQPWTEVERLTLCFPWGDVLARYFLQQVSPGCRVLFVDIPSFFKRKGLYGDEDGPYDDNAQRFAAFSMAALSGAQQLGFVPQVVHLNDWQTGLGALAMKRAYAEGSLSSAKVVFTVHNLAYQGLFDASVLSDLGISASEWHMESIEFHGQASFMKAGIAFADAVTTVSPRYAKDILTHEGGHGLDGFLRKHAHKLSGILNGIDTREWNPAEDIHLPASYSVEDMSGKKQCKEALLEEMGLSVARRQRPLFGVVSRLAHQKGMEWVLEVLPQLMAADATLVVLGAGDVHLEEGFREAMKRYPDKVSVHLGFDEPLSHHIEAGADFFLMPSRFEPCGLNQMYSLRYGTLPIVRATGGLDDTVVDVSQPMPTGIKFEQPSAEGLWEAIERALSLYSTPVFMKDMQRRAMAKNFSWEKSAREYEALYRRVC